MRADKLVAYYRVSTARQEASGLGLGLDAQRQAVVAFLGGAPVVAEFTRQRAASATTGPSWRARSARAGSMAPGW